MNYYNEIDPKAAAWLRELIKERLIPNGHVDERSIADIPPADLDGFTQCHFFAGIGGWPYALRLADWPEDRPVWTGSCPCQPFSVAGQGKGIDDDRHLWPAFRWLIAQCRPPVVFGEQVASADGREWLTGVRLDLEALEYEVGAADLCVAGVGAPHIRQRLWWVADGIDRGPQDGWPRSNGTDKPSDREQNADADNGAEAKELCSINHWQDSTWHQCKDGKSRRIPTEPALFPLADGLPGRVGLLRGAGNAITPQVAEMFIRSFLNGRQ